MAVGKRVWGTSSKGDEAPGARQERAEQAVACHPRPAIFGRCLKLKPSQGETVQRLSNDAPLSKCETWSCQLRDKAGICATATSRLGMKLARPALVTVESGLTVGRGEEPLGSEVGPCARATHVQYTT